MKNSKTEWNIYSPLAEDTEKCYQRIFERCGERVVIIVTLRQYTSTVWQANVLGNT